MADRRGHEVILLERQRRLGGSLVLASTVHSDNEAYLDWIRNQVTHSAVDVRLGHEADAALVHCPTSNTFIGSGLFDVAGLMAEGQRIGLATDTGGGSSFSMLRTMAAMGIATSAASCGSSSASGNQSPPVAPPPPPPPPNRMQSPRPGDWPANVGAGRSVVILGGGIAGMTTALEIIIT